MSVRTDEMRSGFKASDDIRDAGLTTPEDILRIDDIVYGPFEDWQKLDVYRPKGTEDLRLPVIVSVHGGGWAYGDKERYQYYCMSLAQHGFAVVNFTYRLAPEFSFPAMLEDTCTVFDWVLDNAGRYAFDTERVFGVGDSAGGHLLALYCCLCTNKEYAKCYSFEPEEGFCPTAVALNCGKYSFAQEEFAPDTLMADVFGRAPTAEEAELMQVLPHVTSDFPPAFVMTGTGDFLKEDALEMTQRLASLDVPCIYRLYGSSENKLGHVFHCNMRLEDGAKANKDECDFFKSFCKA